MTVISERDDWWPHGCCKSGCLRLPVSLVEGVNLSGCLTVAEGLVLMPCQGRQGPGVASLALALLAAAASLNF
jgi:hypothetical protein